MFPSRSCTVRLKQLWAISVAPGVWMTMQPPLWQRLVTPLLYLLPWSDAIPLGFAEGGLFLQYPLLSPLALPAIPLMQLERSIPFGLGGILLFFVLFLGVVRNPNVPYFVRFNALQALLTDIALIVLSIGFRLLLTPLAAGSLLLGTLSSTVVIAVLAILLFALVECLRGREPDLPGISQAVRMQLY